MGDEKRKPAASSQTALLALGGILTVLGGMMPSPDGRLLCFVAAGLVAGISLFFCRSRIKRAIACLILAATVLQVVPAWREYRVSLERYRGRAFLGDMTGSLE